MAKRLLNLIQSKTRWLTFACAHVLSGIVLFDYSNDRMCGMNVVNWLAVHLECFVVVVVVAFLSGLIGWKTASRKNANKQVMHAGDYSAINQAGRDVNISNAVPMQTPEVLAVPVFKIRNSGYTFVAGKIPRYQFMLINGGGDCYHLSVSSSEGSEKFEFPHVKRGDSFEISLDVGSDSSDLRIFLSGLDCNGLEYKKCFFGMMRGRDFCFH